MELTLIAGFFAAMLHVLSGPDHLAAVTPLVLEKDEKHYRIGIFWGLGHLIGMLLIGGLFYFLKDYIPVDTISGHSEKLVGLVLIGIGIWAIYRIYHPAHKHIHPHKHDESGLIHIHKHTHTETQHKHTHQKISQSGEFSAMSVGVLHGFAGISHFILMLPVLGLKNKWDTVGYLVGFGLGTIVAMGFYAFIIGKIRKLKQHPKQIWKDYRFWGGLLAIGVGIYWLIFN